MEWWQRSKPEQIQAKPWLHADAIEYFETVLQPDYSVIEHGSGGSTLWLAERVKVIWSFEHDPDWQGMVSKLAKTNTKVFSPDFLYAILKRGDQFDLLFIDGDPPETRRRWLTEARRLVVRGGWVVLDNANRPEYEIEHEALKDFCDLVKAFNRNESFSRYFVTEFWRVR